jgi:plasmid stabilization system protein ParE
MIAVLFRREADADLHGIVEWYQQVAPESVSPILSDIYRSIDLLTAFPRAGAKVANQPFRRIVSRKYHFKIAYDIAEGKILILGIYRQQDRER